MAISREQVEAAVERYLPKTANYSYSADLINQDLGSIFDRIQQIILTNLLVDRDAIFYIIYLSSRRMLEQIDAVIDLLNALDSTQQLRGISGEDPSRVDDLTQLRAAQSALVRLSTGLVNDSTFGDDALASFQTNIESFMSEQLVPNASSSGNRVKTVSEIRATMESLKVSWASVLLRREKVFSLLDKFMAEDLRTRVSSIIISSIQTLLSDLERTLPTQTTEQQAESAESTLTELAAAEAALVVVGNAPSPLGEVIISPTYDGRTTSSYLVVSGLGRTEPLLPVLTGENGRLRLTGPDAGSPFTSLTGRTVTPGVGTIADRITDASVPDFDAEGISAGMYITFVDLGFVASITAVTPVNVVFSPGLRDRGAVDLRYAITDHIPGEYLTDPVTAFGSVYETDGESQSTYVDGESNGGSFIKKVLLEGSDGTNVRASGTTGEFLANKAEGLTSSEIDIGGGLSHLGFAAGTFLSSGVVPGDVVTLTGPNAIFSPVTVTQVLSETLLEVSASFASTAGNAFYVHAAGEDQYFTDPNANFISDQVAEVGAGDFFFSDSAQAGFALVIDFPLVSQTQFGFVPADVFTRETGITYEITPFPPQYLYSPTIDFGKSGVQIGDEIDIDGEVRLIAGVDGNRVLLAFTIDAVPFSGANFVIYRAIDTVVTDKFLKTNGSSFDSNGVGTYMTTQVYVSGTEVDESVLTVFQVDGVNYQIARLDETDPANVLYISPLRDGVGNFVAAQSFESEDADFLTAGVDPLKHSLVIRFGTNAEQVFEIQSVDSETELTIVGAALLADGETYEILPKPAEDKSWAYYAGSTTRRVFDTALNNSFQPGLEGAGYVYRPGEAEEVRTTIDTIISPIEAWLAAPVPQGDSGFTYSIATPVIPGMTLLTESRSYEIREVVDSSTIRLDPKIAVSPGTDLVWQVLSSGNGLIGSRVYDEAGASNYDPVLGFTNELSGLRVELETDRPLSATFVQPFDPDRDGFSQAFEVGADVKLGYANVPYRILGSFQNQSNLFYGAEPANVPVSGDVLSIWEFLDPYVIDAAAVTSPDIEMTLSTPTTALLANAGYAVVRGGSSYHGKYLLFEDQNQRIGVEETTDLLRLKVAEVLLDYGEIVIPVADDGGSADGEVVDDGDEDGFSSLFSASSGSFTSQVTRGDRLAVTYGSQVYVTYVDYAVTDTQVRVNPPLPEGSGLVWELGRNSVSSSLQEVEKLRGQMQDLRTLVQEYEIARNPGVDSILQLLKEQRLDRALNLLYDGDFDKFVDLTSDSASYSSRARSSIQGVGASTNYNPDYEGGAIATQLSGIDPSTGKPSPYNTSATSSYSTSNFPGESNVRVQLSDGLADLRDDEYMRSMLFTTDEEQRNRAIYALVGVIESGLIADDDPTLPWIANTGSRLSRLQRRYNKLAAALSYMIENPQEFCDTDVTVGGESVEFEVP